ncbi:MAG: hypothetical protein GY696_14720, partial [Gammaproteobacteria bacterium]|nr:hypothetical protein [Gammaproteobacteria bacterium]
FHNGNVPAHSGRRGDHLQFSTKNGALPKGLTLDKDTGEISGTASNVGDPSPIPVPLVMRESGRVFSLAGPEGGPKARP